MKTKEKILVISVLTATVFLAVYIYLSELNPLNIAYGVVVHIVISLFPFMIYDYLENQKIMRMEKRFPDFLRDIAEGKRAGMTLPQTISNAVKSDYDELSAEIRKLNNLLTWGVPFNEAIENLKRRTQGSAHMQRGLSIVMEAYYSGGNIAAAMDSVASSTYELMNIEKDRDAILSQQTAIMYVIQVIFVGIIIGLFSIFMPLITSSYSADDVGSNLGSEFLSRKNTPDPDYFRTLFFLTIVIQSIANGFVAGETREGKLSAGVKHAGLMLIIGLLAYMIFIYPSNYSLSSSVSESIIFKGDTIEVIGHFEKESLIISNSLINITIGNKTTSTVTNDNGDFRADIQVPFVEGTYEIRVVASHENARVSEFVEIQIQ